jgi:opacity protein-like surface antigen
MRDISRTAFFAAFLTLFLMTSATSSATDLLGLYVGGSIGDARVRSENSNTFAYEGASGAIFDDLRFDHSHVAWKVFAGARPLSFLGIELAYTDFGRASTPPPPEVVIVDFSDSSKQTATTVFGVGYIPLPVSFLDLYGKVGVARLHTEDTFVYAPFSCPVGVNCGPGMLRQTRWSTDFAYGAGAQARIGSVAVRAEYERISAIGADPDLFSLGMT